MQRDTVPLFATPVFVIKQPEAEWHNKEWLDKDWIDENNAPRGWIHWYCHFYSGRRTSDDERQIKRWINFASTNSGRFKIRFQNIINQKGYNDINVSPVIQQNLLEWAVDSTMMKPKND